MVEVYTCRLHVQLESHGKEVSLLIRNVKTNPQSTVSAQPVLLLTKVRLWVKLKWLSIITAESQNWRALGELVMMGWDYCPQSPSPCPVSSYFCNMLSAREGTMAVDMNVLQKQNMVILQCQHLPGVYREEVDRNHPASQCLHCPLWVKECRDCDYLPPAPLAIPTFSITR